MNAAAAPIVLTGVLALLAPVAACTSDPPTAAAPVQLPGLTATLQQYREDEIQGFISVKTSNQSSSTLQFHDLRLQWSGIRDTEPYARSMQLAPGVTFDLRVLEGEAVCGDPPRSDDLAPNDAAFAVGTAAIDGAAPVLVSVPIEDPRSILPKVFRRSCQEQRLTWAADLRFGDSWTPSMTADDKPAMLGSIELRRLESDEPLTISRINGSVLLRINPVRPSAPVTVLAPSQEAATIPIIVEQSGNCAPHALIESKKTFIIPIGFAVGDDEPSPYVITFDTPARQLLNELINESCGLG